MKKFAILLTLIMLCGCGAESVPETPDISETRTETTTVTMVETVEPTMTAAECKTGIDYGNFVPKDVVAPWNEEDINIAISMSTFPEPYNRCFIDFDYDGIPELVLTWKERYYGLLFIFKKTETGIIQIPFNADYDTQTPHSVFGIPPVYEEDFSGFIDSNDKFIIAKDSDDNFYMSGYSHSSDKDTCFIKQIYYEDGKVNVKTVYRWGEFKVRDKDNEGNFDYVFMYKKYTNGDSMGLNNEEYTEVRPEEIEDFLKQIYGGEYEQLYS